MCYRPLLKLRVVCFIDDNLQIFGLSYFACSGLEQQRKETHNSTAALDLENIVSFLWLQIAIAHCLLVCRNDDVDWHLEFREVIIAWTPIKINFIIYLGLHTCGKFDRDKNGTIELY